jgi:hypothetical protein
MSDWRLLAEWDWVAIHADDVYIHAVASVDDPEDVEENWGGPGTTICGVHNARSPVAAGRPAPPQVWLVTGLRVASEIQYGRRTTYMLPVKPNHHRRRFHEGQRLSLKAFVGGSTLAHVVVSDAERIQLGQVDYGLVRELGYMRLDAFQEAWVAEHDPTFEGDPLERFQRRHAHREVWVVRFALDRTDSGGLMAARSEEGYTDSPARAVPRRCPRHRGRVGAARRPPCS